VAKGTAEASYCRSWSHWHRQISGTIYPRSLCNVAKSSKLAVELAQQFNGEIINGDAMQMYEGLPIVTNKIPTEERCGIPHHLLGIIGLQSPTWTVGVFKKRATEIVWSY
jgi:hypothetical protein